MGYDREKRLVLVSTEESGRISFARIRYESVTEAGKRKDLGCMDGIATDKEELGRIWPDRKRP